MGRVYIGSVPHVLYSSLVDSPHAIPSPFHGSRLSAWTSAFRSCFRCCVLQHLNSPRLECAAAAVHVLSITSLRVFVSRRLHTNRSLYCFTAIRTQLRQVLVDIVLLFAHYRCLGHRCVVAVNTLLVSFIYFRTFDTICIIRHSFLLSLASMRVLLAFSGKYANASRVHVCVSKYTCARAHALAQVAQLVERIWYPERYPSRLSTF